MATLVTRNQFNITPQGVVHKPTEAAFIPSPGDPLSGTMRLGQLVNQQPNFREYRAEDVQRIMRELWAEFVASNPDIFNTYRPANRLAARSTEEKEDKWGSCGGF